MRKRYLLVAAGLVLALAITRGLPFSSSGEGDRRGEVRIAAPAATAAPAAAPTGFATPTPAPTPAAEPGFDPPPPPQERNSPDYAKLGVQPAI